MFLEVITPDAKFFEGEVESVTLPGAKGSFQVLNNHAPIISALGKGIMVIKTKDSEQRVAVEGGVAEVLDNKISVLAESLTEE
ncbi:hypothetical protein FUAX_29730 [Fulvitalea axinellae]|uniref:ATP synthase F1 complex delta/epsilon subunit N-terminal domain-containing protein n=1 Tax=Fulvitalea axinellae TaxID=1182444 RepID=A0AAU9DBQ6_9BACT|nr:hypothetical protein FUAX_29730 [Fulvitalea axinellae]